MTKFFQAIQNGDIQLIWLLALLPLVPFFWDLSKFKHCRYRDKILFTVVMFCMVITVKIKCNASIEIISILYILCFFYFSYTLFIAEHITFPEQNSLSLIEKFIREGDYKGIERKFPRRPLVIRSPLAMIKWDMLIASKYMAQGNHREAYEIYSSISNIPLFENEEIDVMLNKSHSLLALGDTLNAKKIFEKININFNEKNKCKYLYIQSIFYEKNGEFERSHESLLLNISEHENKRNIELAFVYNEIGRIETILGNRINANNYYRKSASIASYYHDKNLIHTAFQNIIDNYLLEKDKEKAGSYLSKYKSLISENNVDDLIKFNNYMLDYSRQIGDWNLYTETLEHGRVEILPRLTNQECYIFEISELRIRWNSQYRWEEKLLWLKCHLSYFLQLEFPLRYYLLKEGFLILQELARQDCLGEFTELFNDLIQFMFQSKTDIESYMDDLPHYCVYEHCFWEKESAFLRKIQRVSESNHSLIEYCEGIFKHLHNIKATQSRQANPLEAIESDLNVADECMGLIQATNEKKFIAFLEETLKAHLYQASIELEKFKGHPILNEYSLRVARYALCIGDKEMAKKYFDNFIQTKISINHYSNWIKQYYQDLQQMVS